MPELKLTAFRYPGRVEPTRLCLAIGKIPFENEIVSSEQWSKMRPSTPYGSLPLLTIDDIELAQSNAILIYCGKLTGLYPSDPLEALKASEIVETTADVMRCHYRYMGPDEEEKRKSREKLVEEDLPRYLGGLEKRLVRWSDGPYALGEEISIADLALFGLGLYYYRGILDHVPTDVMDSYPRLALAYKSVVDHPAVVEWYKENPYVMPK